MSSMNKLSDPCVQMSVESVHYEFIRLHEWPFNSDTKYMAVKVTPRKSQVGFSNVVCFQFRFNWHIFLQFYS